MAFGQLAFLLFVVSSAHAQGCGEPAVPANAKVALSTPSIEPGTTATYTCDEGYHLFGTATSTCQPNGRWQGELPVCGTNIALHRPANQSTTVRGGPASNANDGIRTTVHDGRRCTETLREPSPWWAVDLLRPYPVTVVRITTRGCCGQQPLQELEIRVGNSSDLQRNPLCAWYPGTLEEGITKTFTCARTLTGQYVFIQLVGVEGSLSLCEVEIFTTAEFSNDRCVKAGVSTDSEFTAFDRTCYEFNTGKGGSFNEAQKACKARGGDLAHALKGVHNTFLLAELERRKPTLKTQLVWIGARKDPGFTSRTWKWVNGEVISNPSWGRDQPNNYNGEQNCVVLDGGSNWLWNDVGCNLDYLHWICQYKPSMCGSPDKKLNTTIVGANYSIGAEIVYKCPEGHMLVGSEKRKCGDDGFWTGMAPTCKFVDCGQINSIENGNVEVVGEKTWYGSVAKFTCNQNYSLQGEAERVCGDNGRWTHSQPHCLFDWCPDPPQGEGTTVVVTGKKTGSTATYSCKPGFILFGQQVLTCGLGGEWSGKAPTCKFIDCREPPSIHNGQYILKNGTTTHGSIAEYSCEADYWLEPQERTTLTCMRDATWQPPPPSCERELTTIEPTTVETTTDDMITTTEISNEINEIDTDGNVTEAKYNLTTIKPNLTTLLHNLTTLTELVTTPRPSTTRRSFNRYVSRYVHKHTTISPRRTSTTTKEDITLLKNNLLKLKPNLNRYHSIIKQSRPRFTPKLAVSSTTKKSTNKKSKNRTTSTTTETVSSTKNITLDKSSENPQNITSTINPTTPEMIHSKLDCTKCTTTMHMRSNTTLTSANETHINETYFNRTVCVCTTVVDVPSQVDKIDLNQTEISTEINLVFLNVTSTPKYNLTYLNEISSNETHYNQTHL